MSAHISFPKISNQQRLPATMDPDILNGILIDSLQFDGLVVTDALEMQGITDHFSPGEAAQQAIQAGSDILLISPDATAAMHHIRAAVGNGQLSEERINRSALKLLKWKFRRGLFKNRKVELNQLTRKINPPEYQVKSEQIARQSITVLANKLDILPLHSEDYPSICAVALADDKSGNTGSRMGRALRRYHDNVRFHTFDRRSGEEEKARIRRCAQQSDLLVIGSFIYVKTYQDINMNREQRTFIEALSRYQNPEVLISFGNPYIFDEIPHAEVDIQAWAPFDIQVDAAVEALFGVSPVTGKMPIRFPGHFEPGDGLEFPQSAPSVAAGKTPYVSAEFTRDMYRKIGKAISDSTFPGASVMIMEEGRMIYHNAFGYQSFDKQQPLKLKTPYSLPGLTTDIAGIPYLLTDLQRRQSSSSPSKGDSNNRSEVQLTDKLLSLFSPGSTDREGDRWTLVQDYQSKRHSSPIEEVLNRQLWRPLEMKHTKLKIRSGIPPDTKSSTPVVSTTTWDLSKLLFTLMNEGRYKDRQIMQDSLTHDFISISNGRLHTYRELGDGFSRIWIDHDKKRSIVFLVRTAEGKEQESDTQEIKNVREDLFDSIHEELSRPHVSWDFDKEDKFSS